MSCVKKQGLPKAMPEAMPEAMPDDRQGNKNIKRVREDHEPITHNYISRLQALMDKEDCSYQDGHMVRLPRKSSQVQEGHDQEGPAQAKRKSKSMFLTQLLKHCQKLVAEHRRSSFHVFKFLFIHDKLFYGTASAQEHGQALDRLELQMEEANFIQEQLETLMEALQEPKVRAAIYTPELVRVKKARKEANGSGHSQGSSGHGSDAICPEPEGLAEAKQRRRERAHCWQAAVRAAASHLGVQPNYGCRKGSEMHTAAMNYHRHGHF
jgi:hypothetical protein